MRNTLDNWMFVIFVFVMSFALIFSHDRLLNIAIWTYSGYIVLDLLMFLLATIHYRWKRRREKSFEALDQKTYTCQETGVHILSDNHGVCKTCNLSENNY